MSEANVDEHHWQTERKQSIHFSDELRLHAKLIIIVVGFRRPRRRLELLNHVPNNTFNDKENRLLFDRTERRKYLCRWTVCLSEPLISSRYIDDCIDRGIVFRWSIISLLFSIGFFYRWEKSFKWIFLDRSRRSNLTDRTCSNRWYLIAHRYFDAIRRKVFDRFLIYPSLVAE